METYLKKSCKIAVEFEKGTCRQVVMVMGNESGDLDSVVCALVYAYFLDSVKAYGDIPVVPVHNFNKEDLPVKTEVTYYLKRHDIPLDSLVFWDSARWQQLTEGVQVVLVDHHAMPQHTLFLRSAVVEIVDHHPQAKGWTWPQVPMTLQRVGSCCTLVTQKIISQNRSLINCQVASLLYGPIVIDTACFSPAAGKATELDLQMAAELESLGVDGTKKESLFSELIAARSDVSNLSPKQLLVKDLKIAAGLALPGFPLLVQEFLSKPDVLSALKEFSAERGTPVIVLLGLKMKGEDIQRDLAVFNSGSDNCAEKVVSLLLNSTEPVLQLEPVKIDIPGVQLFKQLNISASRKQILPIVIKASEQSS